MKPFFEAVHDGFTESRFSLDNLDVVFYFGSMFFDVPVDRPPATHAHEHAWFEVHCVKKGSLKVTADSRIYDVKANETLFIPPQQYHITDAPVREADYMSFGLELLNSGRESREGLYEELSAVFSNAGCTKLKKSRKLCDAAREVCQRLR